MDRQKKLGIDFEKSDKAFSVLDTKITYAAEKSAAEEKGCSAEAILKMPGEQSELHEEGLSRTAKFFRKIIPSIAYKQDLAKDYTIRTRTGDTVGNLFAYIDSKDSINIVWLGIQKEGKGYGQSAMKVFLDSAKKSGFKEVTLEVPTNSPNARHIYEKLGFEATDEKMLGSPDDVWGGLTKMKLKF